MISNFDVSVLEYLTYPVRAVKNGSVWVTYMRSDALYPAYFILFRGAGADAAYK